MDSTSKNSNNTSNDQSSISLESIHSVLTQMGARMATLQKQLDRLSAKVGLDTDVVASKLSAKDAARQRAIIARGDAEAAYEFASDKGVTGSDIQALQQVVIERGDGNTARDFARDIPGADIQALQHVVLECCRGWGAYRFAKEVPGADIKALQQVVLDRGDGVDANYFARDIEGADLVALHKKITKMGGHYLKSFNNDHDIQARLKTQLEATGQSEPEEITHSKKHRPS